MNNYSWPSYSSEEISSVVKVLRSNKVNYLFGNKGKEFEASFSKYIGSEYSLAVANGTLALDLCLRACKISTGDEVIVTSRSFVASASCILALGAIPIFSDVDINSQNITPHHISSLISRRTKAIICVHFAGYPCEMPEIMKFAKKNNIYVIEDCAQAHGATINGKSVGTFGDINAWSFCNDKIMTTCGEGGMVTTNSKNLYKLAEAFNNHGKNFKKIEKNKNKRLYDFPFVHDQVGLNYRMTEMQSAVGIIQLKKLPSWQKYRKRNAEVYINEFKDLRIVSTPAIPNNIEHAWYKLYLTINTKYLSKGITRKNIIEEINKNDIYCSFGSCGSIYKEKAFKGLRKNKTLNSSFLEEHSIVLEVHPTIPKKIIVERSKVIKKILLRFQA